MNDLKVDFVVDASKYEVVNKPLAIQTNMHKGSRVLCVYSSYALAQNFFNVTSNDTILIMVLVQAGSIVSGEVKFYDRDKTTKGKSNRQGLARR